MRVRWPIYNIPFIKTDFLVSKETVLHGPLQAACGGRIDGLIKGDVSLDGALIIGKKAEIRGDVTAKAAKIYGKVYGNVTCSDLVLVYNKAMIKGDITAKIIELKEGAQVDGIVIKKDDTSDSAMPGGEDGFPADADETATEAPADIEPQRSTDKDRDATNWF